MENGNSDLDSERRVPTGNRSYRFGRPLLTPPRPYSCIWFAPVAWQFSSKYAASGFRPQASGSRGEMENASHFSPDACGLEPAASFKRPRQESNLVYDLRTVACLHHTPRTSLCRCDVNRPVMVVMVAARGRPVWSVAKCWATGNRLQAPGL